MTAAEKAQYSRWFPNLNVNAVLVTDNATPAYNCIAWTVGITNRWIWPGGTLALFDAFYQGFGYVRASTGPIAAWGHSGAQMTHGSVSGVGHGPRWESKCGRGLRIQHGLNELTGSTYGRVVAFYDTSRVVGNAFENAVRAMAKKRSTKSYLSASQKRALEERTRAVPPDVREAFDRAFDRWKGAWFSGALEISSDPGTRAVGPAFDDLIALGPQIIPLVVEKLTDPENFLALQLYDTIQPDSRLVVHVPPDDEHILEGEQGRARRAVQLWLMNQGGA